MKLVTYETRGKVRVGVVEGDLVIDVRTVRRILVARRAPHSVTKRAAFQNAARTVLASPASPRDMVEFLRCGEGWWEALGVVTGSLVEALDLGKAPRGLLTPLGNARLRAPIGRPGKITCLGANYADHVREVGIEPPDKPVFFLKSGNTICGPGDPIVLPPNSSQVDYEAEFAVVIGKAGKGIPKEKAYDYVAGYVIFNDVSARDMQFSDQQWFRGKSCDTFAPIGPWIVTRDEVPDPHELRISLALNGETMQDSSTRNLIFQVPHLVSYLSQSLTWEVGDLISTGTPPGVGIFRKPPVFLKPGDTVSITVEKIGTLTNSVKGI